MDSTEQDAALELARRVGERIRVARRHAGMTQAQLAGDRYTKAYISALETGITRPSMVALNYVADRLGLPASHFLGDTHPTWTRLEVDMRLAAGDWSARGRRLRAVARIGDLGDVARAEVLRGLAEAEARRDHGREAIAAASEAARLFAGLGRRSDEALARYWLAYGTYLTDNEADARSQLQALLAQVRDGLRVEPEFEMRVLTALAAVESRVGAHERSLAYLEEARGLSDDLDDRRRATFLFNLAISYRETGDVEAAIRVGQQGWPCTAPPARRSSPPPSKTTSPWPTSPWATSNGRRRWRPRPISSSRRPETTASSQPSWTPRRRSRWPGGSTIAPWASPPDLTSWPARPATGWRRRRRS